MPFARRDAAGQIISLSEIRESPDDVELAPDDPDLRDFLRRLDASQLAETDRGFIRVLEDLIELLISRNVIRFTDLPAPAQAKMLTRQELRDRLRPHLDLLDDDGEGLL